VSTAAATMCERVARLTEDEITERYEALRGMTHFESA